MTCSSTLGAVESFVSLGHVHLPIFGLFVAAGLMGAMALGLKTARLSGVDPDALWDLGVVSMLAGFLLSRLLLVAENVSLFLRFPMALLELPALSAGGVLLTIVIALWYIRHRELSFIGVVEADIPGAALVACFYNLGRFAGGTREGMPTAVPWAVSSAFGRVHPFELYMGAAWLVVCGITVAILRRRPRRGETLGWGMILCGFANAVGDFFHLPNLLYGTELLDRIQVRGIALIVIGGLPRGLAYGDACAVPDHRI